MTRLPEPDPESLSDDVRRVLDKLPDRPLFRQLTWAQTAVAPWIGLGGTLLNRLDLEPAFA